MRLHKVVEESFVITDFNVACRIFQSTASGSGGICSRDRIKLTADDVRCSIETLRSIWRSPRHHQLRIIELTIFVGDQRRVKLLLLGRRGRCTYRSAAELMAVISCGLVVLGAWRVPLLHASNATTLHVVFS